MQIAVLGSELPYSNGGRAGPNPWEVPFISWSMEMGTLELHMEAPTSELPLCQQTLFLFYMLSYEIKPKFYYRR